MTLKAGECSVCNGWVYKGDVLITINNTQYCEACYEEKKQN